MIPTLSPFWSMIGSASKEGYSSILLALSPMLCSCFRIALILWSHLSGIVGCRSHRFYLAVQDFMEENLLTGMVMSNLCEPIFSKVGLALTDYNEAILPSKLESQLFVPVNNKFVH